MNDIFVEKFESMNELLDTINNRPNNEEMKNEDASTSNSYEFSGTRSYEEACDLAKYGYDKILPQIKLEMVKNQKTMNEIYAKKHFIYKNHPIGFIPHVPNAIVGLPDSMITTEKLNMKTKVCNIVYLMDGNCGTDKNLWLTAGPVMLTAIRYIEKSGIRVRLHTCFMNSYSDGTYNTAIVKIKDYGEELNLQRIAFPIAHPSMFRRIGFKQIETVPNLTGNFHCGYGRALTDKSSEYKKLEERLGLTNTSIISAQDIEEVNFSLKETLKLLNNE